MWGHFKVGAIALALQLQCIPSPCRNHGRGTQLRTWIGWDISLTRHQTSPLSNFSFNVKHNTMIFTVNVWCLQKLDKNQRDDQWTI